MRLYYEKWMPEYWRVFKRALWYENEQGEWCNRTQKEAWEMAEDWHWEKFEFYHYEDFESARQGYLYYLNKKKYKGWSKRLRIEGSYDDDSGPKPFPQLEIWD